MVNDQERLKEVTLLGLTENWKKIRRLALRKDFNKNKKYNVKDELFILQN